MYKFEKGKAKLSKSVVLVCIMRVCFNVRIRCRSSVYMCDTVIIVPICVYHVYHVWHTQTHTHIIQKLGTVIKVKFFFFRFFFDFIVTLHTYYVPYIKRIWTVEMEFGDKALSCNQSIEKWLLHNIRMELQSDWDIWKDKFKHLLERDAIDSTFSILIGNLGIHSFEIMSYCFL